MTSKMKPEDIEESMRLYWVWFGDYPEQRNPTDMNTVEKYNFCVAIGYKPYRKMQQARKGHTKKNNWPYPWTKPEYWLEQQETKGIKSPLGTALNFGPEDHITEEEFSSEEHRLTGLRVTSLEEALGCLEQANELDVEIATLEKNDYHEGFDCGYFKACKILINYWLGSSSI